MMVCEIKVGAIWKPSQNPRGTTIAKEVHKIKDSANDESTIIEVEKCKRTINGVFTVIRGEEKQIFQPGRKNHTCYTPTWSTGSMIDERVPFQLIMPPLSWNIMDALLKNVRVSLSGIKSNWKALRKCGKSRMYLPDLSTSKSMKNVREQAMLLINPFIKNHVTTRYKSLTYFRVGAIRSRGEQSQLECVGSLHRDYHNDVNNRVPEERPMSIILALDPFHFLYEHNCGAGQTRTIEQTVPSGHAVLFSSGLHHAGGRSAFGENSLSVSDSDAT
jgi:hypothetical protein